MSVLYVFNPEHDLALANGSPYFDAPLSAKQFATDCRMLLKWALGTDNDIYCSSEMLRTSDISSTKAVVSWGWDKTVVNSLLKAGVAPSLLPSDHSLDIIHHLSNRKVAIDALDYLKHNLNLDIPLPRMLATVDEAVALMEEYGSVVYKMPWSGSGKGIRICRGSLTDNDIRWLANVIDKQKAVMGERYNTVVADFAMEFHADGDVDCCGYSLFQTSGGSYKSSMLMSDHAIVSYLSQWLSTKQLRQCHDNVTAYMRQLIGSSYKGYFGVDMYVYKDADGYKLNPMVEINMRMTMGHVAHALRQRLMANDSQKMYVHYNTTAGNALLHHCNMQQQYSLVRDSEGKILKGYLSLTPPTERSHYNIYVL